MQNRVTVHHLNKPLIILYCRSSHYALRTAENTPTLFQANELITSLALRRRVSIIRSKTVSKLTKQIL